MNLDEMLTPFLTWQFILSSILINAVLIYVTRFVRTVNPNLLERRWFKAILTVINPFLGLLISFVPNFLYGQRFVERAFVGVCAGFLSHFVYSLFVKRLLRRGSETASVEEGAPDGPASEAITKNEKPDSEKSK